MPRVPGSGLEHCTGHAEGLSQHAGNGCYRQVQAARLDPKSHHQRQVRPRLPAPPPCFAPARFAEQAFDLALGGTDYLGIPMMFSNVASAILIFATDSSDGFSDPDNAQFAEIALVISHDRADGKHAK